jgi:hypothetical protein
MMVLMLCTKELKMEIIPKGYKINTFAPVSEEKRLQRCHHRNSGWSFQV